MQTKLLMVLCLAAMPGWLWAGTTPKPLRPGDADWPTAWMTYREVKSLEADIEDIQAHGANLISSKARSPEEIRKALEVAKKTGIKYHIDLPEVTEHAGLVKTAGFEPEWAIMIGGVYQGKAIDRHVFSFEPRAHKILIEPPVYSAKLPYNRNGKTFGHYYPEMNAPLSAEVIVPLKDFDGRQHLRILPAHVQEAPAGSRLEVDSTTGLPESSETEERKLYTVGFDLTGLEGALLDKVGIAVYWKYGGYKDYWMFGQGTVSAWAESTRATLRKLTTDTIQRWSEANGGPFPLETVLAVRFGDECFYTSGHLNGPAVNYPLWDYSESSIREFRKRAGAVEYPRTWGYPEIYGADAYAWWLYTLHEGCAQLCGVIRDEIARSAPGLLAFRNTTRMGVFHPANDFDGSGNELLTRNLDVVHFDPYPVGAGGYKPVIPRDMSYAAGLARRYGRLLIPWMQAHTYAPGGLTDVSPEQVERMADEQWVHGVDAVMWLGYGSTFPKSRPDSWDQAAEFHKRLLTAPPPKPVAKLAVLRHYREWALSSQVDEQIRNPADWLLQQFLEVWAVRHGQPYDVFEVPPKLTGAQRQILERKLHKYPLVISTQPFGRAVVIGRNTEGTAVNPGQAPAVQNAFEEQILSRRWLSGNSGNRAVSR